MSTRQSTPTARPWGCVLLVLAALLLVRGAWLTWPEGATREWPRPPFMRFSLTIDPTGRVVILNGDTLEWHQPLIGILDDSLTIAGGTGDLRSWALSADGQWLAFSRTSSEVDLWSVARRQLVARRHLTPPPLAKQLDSRVLLSPDGQVVAWIGVYQAQPPTNRFTSRVEVWDRSTQVVTWSQEWTYALPNPPDVGPGQLLFNSDGQLIVLAGNTLEVRRVATNTTTYRVALDPCCGGASDTVISPDQQWLASSGQGRVTIRRFSDGAIVRVLAGSTGDASVLTFSPDSRYLAVGVNTTTSGGLLVGAPQFPHMLPVTLWEVGDWRPVQIFQGHLDGARGMAFTPDGQYLATYGASGDRTIRIWRVAPHNPFEPPIFLGSGLALLLVAIGRWIWQRRRPRA